MPADPALTVANRLYGPTTARTTDRCPNCGAEGTLALVITDTTTRRACVGTGGRKSCGWRGPVWMHYRYGSRRVWR